jgi:hypothetical protein
MTSQTVIFRISWTAVTAVYVCSLCPKNSSFPKLWSSQFLEPLQLRFTCALFALRTHLFSDCDLCNCMNCCSSNWLVLSLQWQFLVIQNAPASKLSPTAVIWFEAFTVQVSECSEVFLCNQPCSYGITIQCFQDSSASIISDTYLNDRDWHSLQNIAL